MSTPKHGGPRPNAGRKKAGPTVRLQIRVSRETADRLYTESRRLKTEDIARGVESAAKNLPALPPEQILTYAPTRGRPRIVKL